MQKIVQIDWERLGDREVTFVSDEYVKCPHCGGLAVFKADTETDLEYLEVLVFSCEQCTTDTEIKTKLVSVNAIVELSL